MKNLTLNIIIYFLISSFYANAQQLNKYDYKGVEIGLCDSVSLKFEIDSQANNYVTQIVGQMGLPNYFVVEPCSGIDNFKYFYKNGQPYIFFNPNYINQLRGFNFSAVEIVNEDKKDWVALFILAHEIGHHFNQHLTNKNSFAEKTLKEMELEADEFAGFQMAMMGASINQALKAINLLENEEESDTHPNRIARHTSVLKGIRKATPFKKSVKIPLESLRKKNRLQLNYSLILASSGAIILVNETVLNKKIANYRNDVSLFKEQIINPPSNMDRSNIYNFSGEYFKDDLEINADNKLLAELIINDQLPKFKRQRFITYSTIAVSAATLVVNFILNKKVNAKINEFLDFKSKKRKADIYKINKIREEDEDYIDDTYEFYKVKKNKELDVAEKNRRTKKKQKKRK